MDARPLTESEIEDALKYVAYKASSLKRKNGKWLNRQEIRLRNKLVRQFKKQMRWVVDNLPRISAFADTSKAFRFITRKGVQDELERLLDDLPFNDYIVESVVLSSTTSYRKGAKQSHADLEAGKYGVSFDLVNGDAVQYIARLKDLHLSNYKGSITKATRDKIRNIILDGAETGKSYSEMAKLIEAQGDAGVFSRERGELIATTEIGNAYSEGNIAMTKRFQDQVAGKVVVYKKWDDVENDCQDECDVNAAEGWIPLDQEFGSGHQRPLAHPRCTCDLLYQTVEVGEKPENA